MKIKKSKLVENFKKFISRGNVVDMAVGVIIGGAFQSIINALVKGILMPLIAFVVPSGGIDGIVTVLNHDKAVVLDPAAPDAPANTVQYWGHTYDADKATIIYDSSIISVNKRTFTSSGNLKITGKNIGNSILKVKYDSTNIFGRIYFYKNIFLYCIRGNYDIK